MPWVVLEGGTNRALQEKKKVEVKIMKEEEMKKMKKEKTKKKNNGEIRSLRVECDLSANF